MMPFQFIAIVSDDDRFQLRQIFILFLRGFNRIFILSYGLLL